MRGTLSCAVTIFFFFNDTATPEIYTLSLHDALPILQHDRAIQQRPVSILDLRQFFDELRERRHVVRSEEHTSELQSRRDLVCRLLLEKKKKLTYAFYLESTKSNILNMN